MNPRLPFLREKTAKLTTSPGVYLMKNEQQTIIYVGKAKNLKNRVTSYFRVSADHTPKVSSMVASVYDYDFIVTDSEYEALVLECSLIKQYQPKYNILLKDDKGYHYISFLMSHFLASPFSKKRDVFRPLYERICCERGSQRSEQGVPAANLSEIVSSIVSSGQTLPELSLAAVHGALSGEYFPKGISGNHSAGDCLPQKRQHSIRAANATGNGSGCGTAGF